MKRRILTAGLTAVLLALSAAKCDTSAPTQPGHNPGNEAPHADPVFTMKTWVPDKCSPYTVTIDIKGGVGLVAEPTIHVAAGNWHKDISYRSGKVLTVSLGLTMSKAGCFDAYCLIDDGPGNQSKRTLSTGVPNTTCQLNTKR